MIYNVNDNKIGHVDNCDNIVTWSGGLDSTLLLHTLLKAKSTFESPVGALSLNAYFLHKDKISSERKARESFITNIVQPGKFNLVHDEMNMNIVSSSGSMLTQIMNWLPMAVTVASNKANIHIGVLMDDDQSSFEKEIREYHEMLNFMSNKKTILKLPYLTWIKSDVITDVFSEGLEDHVWFCELPEGDSIACGKCNSCFHFKDSAVRSYSASKDVKIKKYLSDKMDFNINSPLQLRDLSAQIYYGRVRSNDIRMEYRKANGK